MPQEVTIITQGSTKTHLLIILKILLKRVFHDPEKGYFIDFSTIGRKL